MGTADINISFGANTAGIQQAMADIRQTVNQTTVGITQSFSTVNKTLNTTNQKFLTINNTTEALKSRWENLAEITTSIRNSFRIAQEVVSRLSAPLAQFSRYEDAAQRLAPLVGGMEKAAAIAKHVKTDAGKLLLKKIKSGMKDYKESRADWTETKYASSLASNTRRLGKLETPPGDAPGGSWILEKVSAEKTKSGKKWKIVSKWKRAAPDAEWDKDIYK